MLRTVMLGFLRRRFLPTPAGGIIGGGGLKKRAGVGVKGRRPPNFPSLPSTDALQTLSYLSGLKKPLPLFPSLPVPSSGTGVKGRGLILPSSLRPLNLPALPSSLQTLSGLNTGLIGGLEFPTLSSAGRRTLSGLNTRLIGGLEFPTLSSAGRRTLSGLCKRLNSDQNFPSKHLSGLSGCGLNKRRGIVGVRLRPKGRRTLLSKAAAAAICCVCI